MTEVRGRAALAYGGVALGLIAVAAASLTLGHGDLRDATLGHTYLALRGARLVAAMLVGAALAVGGVVVQGLFRNPLAEPAVLGTSAGAVLGGNAFVLVTELAFSGHAPFGLPPDVVLPVGCLLGAVVALSLLLALLGRNADLASVLLTGFLLSALFLALGSLVTSMAQERWDLGRAIVSFTLGGLGGVGPRDVAMAAPLIVSGVVAAWCWGPAFDLLLSGDDEAASLGVDVAAVRRYGVLWTAALTAGAVTLGGNIAFVGLLAPHALRPLLGVGHRRLIPAAALGGAFLVAACDLLARVTPARSEIPLGVVTGLVGAPAFLALLVRSRREGGEGHV